MEKKLLTVSPFITLLLLVILFQGCKKPDLKSEQEKLAMQTMSAASLSISINDIYAKLPMTLLHNLGDSFKLDEEKTEWLKLEGYLVVRVPVSVADNTYLYAIKNQTNPEETNVYLVRLYKTSESDSFTGIQEWLDLQTWSVAGLKLENGIITAHAKPEQLIGLGWEECMLEHGNFYMESDGQIGLRELTSTQQPGTMTTMNDDNCHELMGDPKVGFWGRLRKIFNGIFAPSLYEDGPGGGGGGGTAIGIGSGEWSWPIYYPNGSGTSGVGGGNGSPVIDISVPVNSDVATLKAQLNLNLAEVMWLNQHLNIADKMEYFLIEDYIICSCGLTMTDRKGIIHDHLTMMMENQDYVNKINNLTGNWWDRDQNGMVQARKIQMEVYTEIHPYGALDCNDITGIDGHWLNWRDIGSYIIPANVQQRITEIRNQYPSRYTTTSFKIQDLSTAIGAIVNCDFFALHISELPFDSYGQTRMTADQFLDFFRQNIDILDNLGDNTATTYQYYNDPGYLYDYTKFYAGYENSIASLARFHNPAGISGNMAYNDGTVIESGFDRSTNHKWFMYTTIKSPMDGQHPVSGNRRFGILPDANGGYMLYIRGVDKTTDRFTTTINDLMGSVFDGADDLWNSEIKGIKTYIQQHGGSANNYSSGGTVIRRLDWAGTLGNFLKGKITFQQFKTQNNCP